ncbi:MAG: choice-of-anchor Q domain-containing protein [Planctomycetota bacterium]|jgi:predicted outer membrane repeat protein
MRTNLKAWLAILVLLVMMGVPATAAGGVIYVDATRNGDGSDWANACKYLQEALSAATSGDEIWVAEGLYTPDANSANPDGSGNRAATFQLNTGVEIYGGFPVGGGLWGDRDPGAYETVLSGDLNGDDVGFANNDDNSYHVVKALNTDDTAVLDGFVITAGNANGKSADEYGGGLYNYQGIPTVTNCIFRDNSANKRGGAIYNRQCSPVVTNCMFSGNQSGNTGGAIYNHHANSTLTNCTFIGNSAVDGGGLFNGSASNPVLTNCTFAGNSASSNGGAIANDLSSPTVTNCILWGNTAPYGSQISLESNSSLDVSYSDLQGSMAGIYNNGSGSISWGLGNIADDPQFEPDNYHLQAESPCIDAGDPNGDYSGQTDVDGEPRLMGWYVDIGSDEVSILVYYVDDDAPNDPGPGDPDISDPLEDGNPGHPFDSIQEAVDATMEGSKLIVIVLDGTYSGNGNYNIDFGGKSATVYSLNGPANCIIDCENLGRGFDFHSGETQGAIIEGFTITNGQADYGGAISCMMNSSPQIRDCVLSGNTATIHGGGLYCSMSNPMLADCTISNNSPDGIWVEGNGVWISGVVEIVSNDLAGDGTLHMEAGSTLEMHNSIIFCDVFGPGTIQVGIESKLIISGDAVIDLADPEAPADPNSNGHIICEGPLQVTDNVQILNANISITVASLEDSTSILFSKVTVDSVVPYGQFFLEPGTTLADSEIRADGDRYTNLKPSFFAGGLEDILIFVTINEGEGGRGGLLELRGQDGLVSHSCEPGEFLCQVAPGTLPPCSLTSWTLQQVELTAGSKANLTNRSDYQPPYDSGGEDEVLYVKKLILRQNSTLNTGYNRVYYETLIVEPNAVITNEPLLDYSLTNMVLNDEVEFIYRVIHNNFEDPTDPNNNRIHVEWIQGSSPDPCGMMVMRNLVDQGTGQVVNARAKGLFAKADENEVFIRFEYLFGTTGLNAGMPELIVSLSEVPELPAPGDHNSIDHRLEVARVYLPPPDQYGSIGSDQFGVFETTVSAGDLDFIRGVRMELELVGPEGTYVLINNWDPFVACIYCGDVTGDFGVSPRDYLTVLGEYGQTSSGNNELGQSLFCLNAQFSDDGYVDGTDMAGWEWGEYQYSEGLVGSLCFDLCFSCGSGVGASSPVLPSAKTSVPLLHTGGIAEIEGPLLVTGKRFDAGAQDFMSDRLYEFDESTNLIGGPFAVDNDRLNGKLVRDYDGQLYQVNLEGCLVRLSDGSSVIPRGQGFYFGNEPRYGQPAMIYIGFQGYGESTWGRPVLDAAFDSQGYIYVTPVVVVPDAGDSYAASAKLESVPGQSPPYNVIELYDDPPLPNNNQDRNSLREIEVDDEGNVYVINSYYINGSDILWVYDSNGVSKTELQSLGIYRPIGLCCSSYDNSRLYVASSLGDPDAASASVHVLSTTDLTLIKSIDITNMGHITDITEDPSTGALWVVGFTMPVYMTSLPGNLSLIPQFYDPYLATVSYDSNGPVSATHLSSAGDLALPLSIVWTGAFHAVCGGANLDGIGNINFDDFAILASQWQQSPGSPSADVAPEGGGDGTINLLDLAVLADYWLASDCGGSP